jgi:HEAT repeat protein
MPRCRLTLLALLTLLAPVVAAESDTAEDEEALRAAHLPTDGPGLLAFFRKRTPNEETRAGIEALVEQLGSDSFSQREQASAELVLIGPTACALLREATHDPDLEVRWRARQALADIQRGLDPDLLACAARVLARRNPDGGIEALLAYLPFAEEASLADDVCLALASAAVRDGNPDPTLVRSLTDRDAIIRGAAGAALAGCRAQLAAVRRLLHDANPSVRQRVALSLLEARDKSAVPVLIALLTELPPSEAKPVEAMLMVLAGDRAPAGDLDGDDADRRRYREAWSAWWTRHDAGLDMAKVEGLSRPLGRTLVVQLDLPGTEGRVFEQDSRGRTRWQIKDLQYPLDAQVLDSRRVLVAEYNTRRVSERNHKGEVLWQTTLSGSPICARRLPNGNTFIASRSRVYEVDRTGAEVWTLNHSFGLIVAACPLRDGSVAVVSQMGEYQRLDRSGKVLNSFRVGRIVRSVGTQIDVMPNGHVLIPFYTGNSVVEYDADGKAVWSAQAYRPTCVQRLPDGHTLIASRMSNVLVEVDRRGQEVSCQRCDGRLVCVRRR